MRSLFLVLLWSHVASANPLHRSVTSGPERRSLLELYTSEGCSSCPPTDAWLHDSAPRLAAQRIIPLAFHVDYWNELGWIDPFSQPQFTARQRAAVERDSNKGHIYTPELVLDGHEVDRAGLNGKPEPARARLTLDISDNGAGKLRVTAHADAGAKALRLYVAIYENGLVVSVPRGENAGRTLRHDYVVRELIGPVAEAGSEARMERDVRLRAEWNQRALGVMAFVEDARTGEVLQAVDLSPPLASNEGSR